MADQSASQLLSLPAELRNAIWAYVLVHVPPDQITSYGPVTVVRDEYRPRKERFCANVLRACKQTNGEGTPILYGENTFSAHSSLLAALPAFILRNKPTRLALPPVTCPRVARMIRRYHIHVRLDTDPRFTRMQVEESFAGVEELEIEVFQVSSLFPG